MARSLLLFVLGSFVAALFAFSGCGSETVGVDPFLNPEAGANAEAGTCLPPTAACATDTDCCSGTCDATTKACGFRAGACGAAGSTCKSNLDCCTTSCIAGACSDKQCVADGQACKEGGECCGGTCEGGTCKPLSGSCGTAGNPCAGNATCCSGFCRSGFCSAPSFCTQNGDACANDLECCGGSCLKQTGAALGLCQNAASTGATGCTTAGQICGNGATYDGGALPTCGGECCSRSCLPYAPTGVFICQPPSGCRPTGELCKEDVDCCGSATQPDGLRSNVSCNKATGALLGRCDNGNACSPAGAICRLKERECNANANCCAGNVLQKNTCKQDALGIPRCLIAAVDCSAAPSTFEGKRCASSADCCGLPCVPNPSGDPPLVCSASGTRCISVGGACTTTSDCCSGSLCNVPPGSTRGTCSAPTPPPGPGPAPAPCAAFGQLCSESVPCCNEVVCGGGVCGGSVVR
jgi:hypothetical protein